MTSYTKIEPCHSCEAVMINGHYCHETGCPDAWRTQPVDCFQCGYEFIRESRFQRICEDCQNDNDNPEN